MIIQKNKENVPFENEEKYPGFSYVDAMHFADNLHITYKQLALDILKEFPNCKKILDIGSGNSSLASHLKDINNDLLVVSIDGNRDSSLSPHINNHIHLLCKTDEPYEIVDDINDELIIFDLILSFEHFEHIEHKLFDKFLNNMKLHSNKDTIFFATAANWGYEYHINVKSKEEWYSYLNENGFEMIEKNILNEENAPFCFDFNRTSELIFKFKK